MHALIASSTTTTVHAVAENRELQKVVEVKRYDNKMDFKIFFSCKLAV
jgi:hypothetical protein